MSASFERFREHWFDGSFLEEGLDGEPVWANPKGVRARDVEWLHFLSDIALPEVLCEDIALKLERIDPPLMLVLPQLVKAVVESVRRSSEAPGFKEIGAQLALLQKAATRLADAAQGGTGRGTPSSEPEWWTYDKDDVYRKHIQLGLRAQEGRSPYLHPLLQDHLSFAMAPDAYSPIQPSDPAMDEKLRVARNSLTYFFKHLHHIIPVIENARSSTKKLEDQTRRLRRRGAPEDAARNWALVRLMWVWRDVLGGDPAVHMRKTRGKHELDEPEPQGCMAFVVANLAEIDPVGPHNFPALERHLQTLKSQIPSESLLRDI